MTTTSSKRKTTAKRKLNHDAAPVARWRDDAPCVLVSANTRLSVESAEPFMLHFGCDGWQRVTDVDSRPLAAGGHAAEVDLARLGVRQSLEFTRRFIGPRGWEHHDWQVRVGSVKRTPN